MMVALLDGIFQVLLAEFEQLIQPLVLVLKDIAQSGHIIVDCRLLYFMIVDRLTDLVKGGRGHCRGGLVHVPNSFHACITEVSFHPLTVGNPSGS